MIHYNFNKTGSAVRIVTIISAVLLFINLTDISAQYTWQTQRLPVDTDLASVSFVDTLHGWIAAKNGDILSTGNAGENWQTIAQIGDITPTKICFVNENLGWVAGSYNTLLDSACILRTTNGGTSWTPVFQRLYYCLNDLFFINDTMGWTAGCERSPSDSLSLINITHEKIDILYTNRCDCIFIYPQQ